MTMMTTFRAKAAAAMAGLSLLLTSCFITPGEFESELRLTDGDQFSFTYEGEIFFLGLGGLAQLGAAFNEFEAECYDEDTFEDRECTAAEEAEQRAQWDADAETRAAEAEKSAAQLASFMGGVDPTDPAAAEEVRALLLRQKGWNRVEYNGDGLYTVSYAISGSLGHDFVFPMIEGFPASNPFVQIILRDEEVVRINAPGFAAENENNPMGSMLGGVAGIAGLAALDPDGPNPEGLPDVPAIEGNFTIITDGTIRANNTDEGSVSSPEGEVLSWAITPRTKSAPTALIDLSR